MKQPIIKIENVRKAFNGNVVLDGVSCDIYSNEIFGIIGSSGSGKTTFLHTIIGFLNPDSGDVYYKDDRIVESSANSQFRSVFENLDHVKGRFGFASQNPSCYAKLTVFENLDYFGSLYNLSREARLTNINTLLDLVELENARNVRAENLSGGMQRRLDIACSLIHDPSILLLDEPTSDLDPVLAKHIWSLLQKINRRGTTVIVASHHFAEIEAICSRIGIITKGKLMHVGTIHELTGLLAKGQEIHIETYPGNYEKILKSINDPNVISKENRGNELVLHSTKPDKVLHKLLHSLSEIDEKLMDVSITKFSLNDVFAKVAKKQKK
jgi:ABC-2 type transport system ATP-binding protein